MFLGGSTNWPVGPPKVWTTPTEGFPGLPTIAIRIVTPAPFASAEEFAVSADEPDVADELTDVAEPAGCVPGWVEGLSEPLVHAAMARLASTPMPNLLAVDVVICCSPQSSHPLHGEIG